MRSEITSAILSGRYSSSKITVSQQVRHLYVHIHRYIHTYIHRILFTYYIYLPLTVKVKAYLQVHIYFRNSKIKRELKKKKVWLVQIAYLKCPYIHNAPGFGLAGEDMKQERRGT